jgi:hypothetical protein
MINKEIIHENVEISDFKRMSKYGCKSTNTDYQHFLKFMDNKDLSKRAINQL